MKKFLHGLCVTLIVTLAAPTVFAARPKPVASRAEATQLFKKLSNRYHKANTQTLQPNTAKLPKAAPITTAENVSTWGWLYTPEGTEWLYTGVFNKVLSKYIPADENDGIEIKEYTIGSVDFVIYDENLQQRGSFTVTLPEPDPGVDPGKQETGINDVQIAPQLTRKFFNVNDAYEVMVYVHATTADYSGHDYTVIYSLATSGTGATKVTTIEGNQIAAVNTPKDAWDETYTMVFMRDEYIIDDNKYTFYFDVYHKACYFDDNYPGVSFNSKEPTLLHTFTVDYSLISGSGDAAFPILVNAYGGDADGYGKKVAFILPNYEKPFWIPYEEGLEQGIYSDFMDYIENPVLSPDNHFLIKLHDCYDFSVLKTTSIPMTEKPGYAWSFPGMGLLLGNGDASWGMFGEGDDPHYIVGYENYRTSADDFITDFKVYDANANCVKTLYEDAMDYIAMSDVDGFEREVCFIQQLGDTFNFDMVDVPSGKLAASIPNLIDGESITTEIDRAPFNGSYKYISSMRNADVDAAGNILHGIAWFNADGSIDHIDRVNLGSDVAVALPWISGSILSPYIFNTDDKMEYLFLVKHYVSPSSSTTEEYFRVYNADGKILLEAGPQDNRFLSSVFVLNPRTSFSKLVTAYSDGETQSISHYDLPLNLFSGGSGTVEDPWIIASEGDFYAMESYPNAHFAMGANVDFKGAQWSGLTCNFTGSFDGRGYIISNVELTGDGIFNKLSNAATVQNFSLFAAVANGRSFIAGNTIGNDDGVPSKVVNVNVYNSKAECDKGFGGIVWQAATFSLVQGCSVVSTDITVNSTDMETPAGALVGRLGPSAVVEASYSKSTVTAPIAGGIVGESYHVDGAIRNCHSASTVQGQWIAGGIIGNSARSAVDNCLSDGSVTATGAHVSLYKKDYYQANAGGIIGWLLTFYADDAYDVPLANECVSNGNVTAKNATECIARRIVGSVSSDRLEPSGEETDPSGGYILDYGPAETRIGNSYSTSGSDSDDPREGHLITDLSTLPWPLGTSYDAPWVLEGSAMHLFIENANAQLVALPTEATVYAEEDAVEITFSLIGSNDDIKNIKVECENSDVVTISDPVIAGQVAMVRATYVADGATKLYATLGALEAVANVTARTKNDPVIAINVDKPEVKVGGENPDPVEVTFTVKGGKDIRNLQVVSDNEDVVSVSAPVITDHSAKVTLTFGKFGTANVTASLLECSALCVVSYDLSGIDAISGDTPAVLYYDGETLTADGFIRVFNPAGALVASGSAKVDVTRLPAGIYFATAGPAKLKFVVR
ncbi:MAG: hypothetical protein HUK14_05085 [Muribaculaceae bacterium]|nr:hypothetical protein [Muribaculaceae bacterium]